MEEVQLLNFHVMPSVQATQSMPCSLWHVTVHGTLQRSDSLIYLRQGFASFAPTLHRDAACLCMLLLPDLPVASFVVLPKRSAARGSGAKRQAVPLPHAKRDAVRKLFFHCESFCLTSI